MDAWPDSHSLYKKHIKFALFNAYSEHINFSHFDKGAEKTMLKFRILV